MNEDAIAALIDKLDKEDFGLPLIVGGGVFAVELIVNLSPVVAPGPVGLGAGVIVLGGKFLYDKAYGNRKKLKKSYKKLSEILSKNGYEDLKKELDITYELFEKKIGNNGGKTIFMKKIVDCAERYEKLQLEKAKKN